ncbi:MAG: hypothetical protein EXS67_03630 [Candidatus Margulisbacteria bacterium]|nr:hypothetical protein [Candidatus Margulisiibacteriota bacterium]
MAVSFTSLAVCIKNADHVGFLKSYMQLVAVGKHLVVPTNDDYESVKSAWAEILFGVPGGYTDDFLINVTRLWMHVVVSSDAPLDTQFPQIVIGFLDAEIAAAAAAEPVSTPVSAVVTESGEVEELPAVTSGPISVKSVDVKTVSNDQRRMEQKPGLMDVAGSISEQYFDGSKSLRLPSIPEATGILNKAFSENEADVFLIAYLSIMLQSIKVDVPMSSVMDIIYARWREILMGRFNKVVSERFLKSVSNRWLFLVNQKGLPTTKVKLHALLQLLISEQDKVREAKPGLSPKPVKKSKGFWASFFG